MAQDMKMIIITSFIFSIIENQLHLLLEVFWMMMIEIRKKGHVEDDDDVVRDQDDDDVFENDQDDDAIVEDVDVNTSIKDLLNDDD